MRYTVSNVDWEIRVRIGADSNRESGLLRTAFMDHKERGFDGVDGLVLTGLPIDAVKLAKAFNYERPHFMPLDFDGNKEGYNWIDLLAEV